MNDAQKICPRCRTAAFVSEKFCRSCGHGFRTVFTAEPVPARAFAAKDTPPLPPLVVTTLPASALPAKMTVPRPFLVWGLLVLGAAALGLMVLGRTQGLNIGASPAEGSPPALTQSALASSGPAAPRSDTPFAASAPLSLDASSLDWEYHKNSWAADERFNGKLLELEGRVNGISRGTSEGTDKRPSVSLYGSSKTAVVLCQFEPPARSSVTALKPGQWVQITGVCHGSTGETVTLEGCKVTNRSSLFFIPKSILSN